MAISRIPPTKIRRLLRREVGFGCPVPGCSSPYLEYHHFDPEWHVKQHHDPKGMIPLCAEHHAKASAWTPEQLRKMKINAARAAKKLAGRFEWMRPNVIGLIGGNFYWQTMTMVSIPAGKVIWFEISAENTLMLNVRMLTMSGEPRTEMFNNDWFIQGDPMDVVSPPNGKKLRVTYDNGDDLQIQFREFQSLQDLAGHYNIRNTSGFEDEQIPFPLLVAEIRTKVAHANIDFTATETRIGNTTIQGFGIFKIKHGLMIN